MNIKDLGYIVLEIALLVYAVVILCWNLLPHLFLLLPVISVLVLAAYYFKDYIIEKWGDSLLTMQNYIWFGVTLFIITANAAGYHYAGRGGGGALLVEGCMRFVMLVYWLLVHSPMQWVAIILSLCIVIPLLMGNRVASGWFLLVALVILNTTMRANEDFLPTFDAYVKSTIQPQLKGRS